MSHDRGLPSRLGTFALRRVGAEISSLLSGAVVAEVRTQHRAGRLVQLAVARGGHGARIVPRLASRLACSEAKLRRLAQFATCFTCGDIEQVLARTVTVGRVVTCSHLFALLPVASRVRRAKLIERALDERLSVAKFKVLIRRTAAA